MNEIIRFSSKNNRWTLTFTAPISKKPVRAFHLFTTHDSRLTTHDSRFTTYDHQFLNTISDTPSAIRPVFTGSELVRIIIAVFSEGKR